METKSVDVPAFQRIMAEGEKLEQMTVYPKAIAAYTKVHACVVSDRRRSRPCPPMGFWRIPWGEFACVLGRGVIFKPETTMLRLPMQRRRSRMTARSLRCLSEPEACSFAGHLRQGRGPVLQGRL